MKISSSSFSTERGLPIIVLGTIGAIAALSAAIALLALIPSKWEILDLATLGRSYSFSFSLSIAKYSAIVSACAVGALAISAGLFFLIYHAESKKDAYFQKNY